MQVPTIGRKVWFYEVGGAGTHDLKQPFDATVIYVFGPTCVNLRVTDHYGNVSTRSSVPLRDPQPTDQHGQGYFCTWMPFQKAQHDKAQAAEAAAS